VHQTIFYTRNWSVHAETACLQGGWIREEHPASAFVATAAGECGPNTSGQPLCAGLIDLYLYDLGYYNLKHSFRANTSDATYKDTPPTGCVPGSPIFRNGDVPSKNCTESPVCCGDNFSLCAERQGDFNQAACECNTATPILLDMNGDGYQLTSFAEGVEFDFASMGTARQTAWTGVGSDDAFLVFDGNANGIVDGGKELFGNYTPQPDGMKRNGFEALGVFDTNQDGAISAADDAYGKLLLWRDRNHNGRSEPLELTTLTDNGVQSISVSYRSSMRKDKHGNLFRYRAAVTGSGGPFAYDIYFVVAEPAHSVSRRPR